MNHSSTSRNRLKVLHLGKFYPPHRGGMETHLQQLCDELRAHVDLHVIVAGDTKRTEHCEVNGVPVTRMGTALEVAATQFCPGLVRAIQDSPADIVHIHWPNPAAVVAYLASGHKGQVVFTYHSDVIRQKLLGLLFNPVLHTALGRSSGIIVSSPNYIASSPILARHRDRCVCIPFGLPLEKYLDPRQPAVDRIRTQYGDRLILAVGRHVYYKGFTYLIDAMRNVNGRLLLTGNGPLRAELASQAEQAGIADRVVFLGSVSDEELMDLYQAVDIFALPSIARSEAFGIVQIEAMAAGKPVVNTSLDSGVPFVSLDGVTGITVPPADSASLAGALQKLLEDEDLRRRYGAAARQRAQDTFNMDGMVAKTLEVYHRAAARG